MAICLLVQIFVITTLICPTISKTIVTQCLEHERTLLLELKEELVFNSSESTKLVQWNKKGDCCRWEGVECDGAGHVISLQLDSEAITGGLNDSSSLFNLEYLEKLNFAHNDFYEASQHPIPRGIEKLTYLTHLNLSSAGFGGRFPIEISQLRRLVSLDLSYNWYGEPPNDFPGLAMFLHNLTWLRELYLDNIYLSTQGSEWCHDISSSTPYLRSLSLRSCGLSGPLDHSLSHLHSLSFIQLDGNNLSSTVPDSFANFSSLVTLSLNYCNLKGYFPEMIFQVPTLQYLDLSGNEFLHGSITHFPNTTSFTTILLRGTNFSGSLPDSISNLERLSMLDLSFSRFRGLIPLTLSNLTELVDVDLSYNFFTGSISSIHFEGHSKLVSIDLSYNSLSGSIPKSIFAPPSLHGIVLSNNQFSGQLNVENISNALSYLILRSNRLEGPIPHSLFQLRSLESLYLSSNLFNGTFQWEHVISLTTLDLSDNNLSLDATTMHSSLENFPDLVKQSPLDYLDLSDNQFAGEIPSWIWEIGNGTLTYLNLSCNMLVGLQKPYNVPTSLSLDFLDLHSNQLRGELPLPLRQASYVDCSSNYFDKFLPNIGNFSAPKLVFLTLANNSLSGSLPTFICNLTNLAILDLSVNNLSGSIPPCLFGNIENGLAVLNLGRNNISGRIPDKFSPNCNLKTLDLSNNNLVGNVPLSLANCNSLMVMNVGTNLIDDVFPCMLTSSLQILVLRSNRFHGEVRCNESWPYLQIIDIASNNLSGYLHSFSFSGYGGMFQDNIAKWRRTDLGVYTAGQVYFYRYEVMLTIKGLGRKVVKIWPEFISIDFSGNNFQGDIPDSIGELDALYLLNLSHNSLTGTIPKSFSNLKLLGSLDLSVNQLKGEIPKELAGLTFLQVMNLSHNKLVGKIPVGSQIQTFSADSFQGNTGLCGLPLKISCTDTDSDSPRPKLGNNVQSQEKTEEIEWDYVFGAAGYVVGLGSIVWVLLCCRSFRDKYFDKVEDVYEKIFDRRQRRKRRVVRKNQVTRQQR